MAAIARAEQLPQHVRGLAELLAKQERIDAANGKKRLELLLEDGKLVEAIVHDRIPARELEQHAVDMPMPAESP